MRSDYFAWKPFFFTDQQRGPNGPSRHSSTAHDKQLLSLSINVLINSLVLRWGVWCATLSISVFPKASFCPTTQRHNTWLTVKEERHQIVITFKKLEFWLIFFLSKIASNDWLLKQLEMSLIKKKKKKKTKFKSIQNIGCIYCNRAVTKLWLNSCSWL